MLTVFKNIFRKEITEPFATIAVDMHSHVLPVLDDGADSLEKSLEMVAGLVALGYRKLIMTPHIMGDFTATPPLEYGNSLPCCRRL